MAATGQTGMGFPEQYGGGGDIGASLAAFETLAFGDLSVLVKVGVHFGLFGGAILQLGTERHHAAYLPDLITGKLMGCFAMTETGHGSNVQALGTVATYDADAGEFVITTTEDDANKDYIGNAAAHAELAVVFAQLDVGRRAARGARLRRPDPQGRASRRPGSASRTTGSRWGSTASTTASSGSTGCGCRARRCSTGSPTSRRTGVYESEIENANRRFFTMLGTLVQGRVCVGGAGINASKVALTIATRYALRRRQFEATSEDEEELLLDYGQHQRRLFPLLAAHLRPALRAGGRGRPVPRGVLRADQRREGAQASSSRGRPAPRRSAPGTPPGPSRSAARPAAARATSPTTGSPRSRPTPTCSPPSRATTPSCCSWWPRGCSPTTPATSPTSTSSAWSASSPASPSRP